MLCNFHILISCSPVTSSVTTTSAVLRRFRSPGHRSFGIFSRRVLHRVIAPPLHLRRSSEFGTVSSGLKQGEGIAKGGRKMGTSLEDLNWDQTFVRELPGDSRTDRIPRQVQFVSDFSLVLLCVFSSKTCFFTSRNHDRPL